MKPENWSKQVVEKYIDDVLSGEITACKYVRQSCQRQLDDMKNGHERGLYFDEDSAQIVIDFFSILQHSKGKWAGQCIELEPWQQFILWCVFGWKKEDGTRRFRIAYNEMARKNGKSTFAAGIGLYGLLADGEEGAEIYSAATKMDQAKIIHQEAIRMVRKSVSLKKRCGIHVNNIHVLSTNSKFEPLGSDAKTLDGLNPHITTVDELHAHPDSSVWDVIRSAIGARSQPLIFAITTAGFNTQCFCKQQRDYALNVISGLVEDDSLFAIVYTLDEGDDWKDEDVWIKANPNIDVSVSREDMRDMAREAVESAEKRNNFMTKKLDIWTTQHISYFNVEKWNQCRTHDKMIDDFAGRRCYLGLDIASKLDITANVAIFPNGDKYEILPFFYCPREGALQRSRKDRVPYLSWAENGWITLTDGNKVDTNFIVSDIRRIFDICDVQMLGFDPWGFTALQDMMTNEGIDTKNLIEVRPVIQHLSEPTKELAADIIDRKIVHNNNPVMTWMIGNTVVYKDPNDNVRPVKNKSFEKIDGVMALIIGKSILMQQKQPIQSVYESRGMLVI